MFIDSHCHLTAKEFDADRNDVIRRAQDAGVQYIINPGTTLDDSRNAVALAEKHDCVYACVGIHPHEASSADDRVLREVEELSAHPKVVAIGEIGLDFHYDYSPRDVQEAVFRMHIAIAQRRGLPVVIHTREAMDRTIAIVEEMMVGKDEGGSGGQEKRRYPTPRGVFHCFPGDVETAWQLIDFGFSISLPGVVTFKNSGHAAAVAASVPVEHLLLETDSPYLAPVPHRGTRNEPRNIPIIAAKVAALQHLSVADVARATNYAAWKLFHVGKLESPHYTYTLRDALYVNLTIRCNADCVFCDRKGDTVIKGINLKIEKEPAPEEVIAEIGDPTAYREIVFCGYGEPTIRLDALKQVARWVKEKGGKTRLNTNGHGSVINKRNIVPELVGVVDAVSVSLNSSDPAEYARLMRLDDSFYEAMLDFTREAVARLPRVMMTVVELDGLDMGKAEKVAASVGAEFVRRPFF